MNNDNTYSKWHVNTFLEDYACNNYKLYTSFEKADLACSKCTECNGITKQNEFFTIRKGINLKKSLYDESTVLKLKSAYFTAGVPGSYLGQHACTNKKFPNFSSARIACNQCDECNGIVENNGEFSCRKGKILMKSGLESERSFQKFTPKFKENLSDTVVLLRTTLPLKKYFYERLHWYSAALYPSLVDIWVIVDVSNVSISTINKELMPLQCGRLNINCAEITNYEVKNLYQNINFDCCKQNPLYCYHAEAFNLWYQKYSEKFPDMFSKYKYFWFWEDDLAFSGDISKFLAFYSKSNADLIAINNTKSDLWFGVTCSNLNIEHQNLRQGIEMTRRVSLRLLKYIHEKSLIGKSGHSEISVNSMCHNANWCKIQIIDDNHIGYKLNQTSRVTEGEWIEVVKKYPDKLFHSLKW